MLTGNYMLLIIKANITIIAHAQLSHTYSIQGTLNQYETTQNVLATTQKTLATFSMTFEQASFRLFTYIKQYIVVVFYIYICMYLA